MFNTDAERQNFIEILAVYCDEFGKENIVITFPSYLKSVISIENFKPCKIEFSNRNRIEITVKDMTAIYIQDMV